MSDLSLLRVPVPIASSQGTLALDLGPLLEPPAPPPDPKTGRPRVRGDVVPIDAVVRGDLERWVRRYAQAVVEIISGDRPVSQLARWTAPRVHRELARRAQVVARAGLHTAGQGRGRQPVVRAAVRSVHTCFVAPGIAEVSVVARHGERSRAFAARFEQVEGRWLCTALDFA